MTPRERLATAIWDKWAIALFGYNRRYLDLLPEERVRVLAVVDVVWETLKEPTQEMVDTAFTTHFMELCNDEQSAKVLGARIYRTMLKEALIGPGGYIDTL